MPLKVFFTLLMTVLFCVVDPTLVKALPDANSSNTQAQGKQTLTMGTVPGIYYDPSGDLSPSLSQLTPAEQSGYFVIPSQDQLEITEKLGYDPSRAWARGATPDQILKIGDLQKSRFFSGISKITLRQIAKKTGINIEQIPLSQIALIREMSVGELYKVFPELEKLPLQDIPFLAQTLANAAQSSRQIANVALDTQTQRALEKLTAIDPRFADVPLSSIIQGDWQGVISQTQAATAKLVAAELLERHPTLANVPVANILSGNWQGAKAQVLNAAQQALVEELAKNSALQGIPLLQLVQGDWQGTLTVLQQQGLKNLLKTVPEISNLPIAQAFPLVNGAIAGDWQGVISQALSRGMQLAGKELFKAIPELKDLPLGTLPIDNLSIASLPGLVDRPLETLPNIANKYLGKLPGLSEVPLATLPINFALGVLSGDLFARLDIAYAGSTETPVENVVTGGTKDQNFRPESCKEKRCPHFELDNIDGGGPPSSLSGQSWVEGKSQMVEGGKGFLRVLNGGKEPTGIPIWGTGAHVKLSLENIKEGSGREPSTAQIWSNFQFCINVPIRGEQCSPHFISIPTPWKVQEGGFVLIASSGEPPEFIRAQQEQIAAQTQAQYESQETDSSYNSCIDGIEGEMVERAIAAVPAGMQSSANKTVPLVLAAAKKYGVNDSAQIAYILSTVQTETSMGANLVEGATRNKSAPGSVYYGRGLVQLTGRENYRKASQLVGVDLVQNPSRASEPEISAQILVVGMQKGLFTNRKLSDYISNGKADFVNARKIVNDSDKQFIMAQDANRYLEAIGKTNIQDLQKTDSNSCVTENNNPSSNVSPPGKSNQAIINSVKQLGAFSTRNFPGTRNGQVACAAAVNKVLEDAGYQRVGGSGWMSVLAVEKDLNNGRGRAISVDQAMPGDIVIVADNEIPGGKQHIGFCLNRGCTQTISNSSSKASFSWKSNGTFSPSYRGNRVSHYRLVN